MAAMMMTAASQAVVSRKTPRTPHAWEAVRTIYESSFPAAERLAFDCVFQQDRGQLVWLAQAVAHHTVAFAVVLPLPGTRAALLEYIAVDAAWRSRGIGRHLLDVIVADVGGGSIDRLVLEVEEPSSAPDAAAARRRLDFYRRWGATPLRGLRRYFIPDCTDPGRRLPMLLLERPFSDEATALGRDGVRAVLRSIAEHEYGLRSDAAIVTDLLTGVR